MKYIKPGGREVEVNKESEATAKELGWKKKTAAKKKAKKKG